MNHKNQQKDVGKTDMLTLLSTFTQLYTFLLFFIASFVSVSMEYIQLTN